MLLALIEMYVQQVYITPCWNYACFSSAGAKIFHFSGELGVENQIK